MRRAYVDRATGPVAVWHADPVSVVHHLSCGSMCPAAGRLGLVPRELVAHCLLVETPAGLVLVDTGFGVADVEQGPRPLGRLGPASLLVGMRRDLSLTALHQVRALGHDPADVTDIVLTHLDFDHAGGLGDFPSARVHVHARELAAALHPAPSERMRYVRAQWSHGPRWAEHQEGDDRWFDFAAVAAVADDVLLVPLPGHTRGHSAVAVRRPGGGWLLHAGDAYFHAGDLAQPRRCPAGLRAFQRVMASDNRARLDNLARLQELHRDHGDEVTVFSAHDRSELEALRGATTSD
jgi:glyoxylase-like metal-dependent hydrolase (beta-lactamase superfamily II)